MKGQRGGRPRTTLDRLIAVAICGRNNNQSLKNKKMVREDFMLCHRSFRASGKYKMTKAGDGGGGGDGVTMVTGDVGGVMSGRIRKRGIEHTLRNIEMETMKEEEDSSQQKIQDMEQDSSHHQKTDEKCILKDVVVTAEELGVDHVVMEQQKEEEAMRRTARWVRDHSVEDDGEVAASSESADGQGGRVHDDELMMTGE